MTLIRFVAALALLPSLALAQATQPPGLRPGGDASTLRVAPPNAAAAPLSDLLKNTPRVGDDGTVSILNGPTLGTFANGRFTARPGALVLPPIDQGSTGDVSSMSVLAPGGNTALPLSTWLARRVDAKSFGAVFDGASHPLSSRFSTLAAAQAVFPFVASLSEEVDGVAIQAAINYCGTLGFGCVLDLPAGSGWVSRQIWVNKSQIKVRGPEINTEQLVFSSSNSKNRYTTRLQVVAGFTGTIFRISPIEDSATTTNTALTGSGLKGVLLDCNKQPGCTPYVQKSTSFFETNIAVNEPLEATVATTAATAQGSTVLAVASTANIPGLEYGASITHPSIPRGSFVRSWTGNTITVSTKVGASFTGSISGTTLTVSALASGAIQAGAKITGPGIAAGTTIVKRIEKPVEQPFKTVDGVGTYQVSISQTVASTPGITTSVASGDLIGVAGEGARFDTAQTYTTNTLSWGEISVQGLNSSGQAPILLVNGAAPAIGSGGGYGNPAHVTFRRVVCYTYRADCTVVGNADHVAFTDTNFFRIDPGNVPDPNGIIALGSDLPAGSNNGPSYSNRWGYVSGISPIIMRGTETYTYPTNNNELTWVDFDNATPLPTMGAGALAFAAYDGFRPLVYDGGNVGVQAQYGDNTVTRGGPRGMLATDLQKCRGLVGQVASGSQSVIGGGCVNSASGIYSTVPGGYDNAAQGRQSVATGMSAYALGVGWRCHSGGKIDASHSAQSCDVPLMAISNANGPIRLTGDKVAATAAGGADGNCLNIPDDTTVSLDILLTVVNRSNTNLRYSWREPNAMLNRQSGAASTVYTASGQASGVGTATWATAGTVSVTASADTTVGCLNLSFVPPSGNTDYLAISATARINWVQ